MGETTAVRTREEVSVETIAGCRLCGSPLLTALWSFGETPLANAYLRVDQLQEPEFTAPLAVVRCDDCHLVQLRHTVPPELLFRNYLYMSSTSPVFVAHFEAYARHLVERFELRPDTLVVDVGSNDGILLKPLGARGVRVLGIEPAARIAALAAAEGIETIAEFLTPNLARALRQKHGGAAVVTANNVFAHTPDIEGFALSVRELLAPDGSFVFEVQYLGDLLEKNLFDIVYHEHLCYYHATPLIPFFARLDMDVFDVRRVRAHGGSIRVFVQRADGPHRKEEGVVEILADEHARGLDTSPPYRDFADRIAENKHTVQELLGNLKAAGKHIVGYGAAAKATTLLSVFGIGAETLDYVVDDDKKMKQGMYMPGTHVPIVPPDRLYADRPEYCLILAWNFAEPIMRNHARFTEQGGRFIVPAPEPRIVEP